MVSFKINIEVMSRVRAQCNESFRGWHEMQRRDTTPVKINGSKARSSFEKVEIVFALRQREYGIVRLTFKSVCMASM